MARKISVEIVGDARSLERAFAKSSKSARRFQGDMDKTGRRGGRVLGALNSTAGALGVTLGSAAVVAGIKSSINAAKDLGESVNAVNVVFGDASKTITDFSDKALVEAGLSMREFNQLATPLGAMLRNTGDSADEAADKTVVLAKRAADMASVFNTDVPTALEAIQSALRGEADPIERFGVKLNEAAVKAEAMRLGLTDGKAAIDENAKAAARYSLILKQTNRYQGDFRNTSGGLANQQRILSAALENLSAKLGTALLPIITKLTTALAKWLSNSKNQKTVLDTVNAAIGAVTTAAKILSGTFQALNSVTGSTKNTFKLLLATFVAFKALKLVSYIAGMTKAMRGFAGASAAANAAGMGGRAGAAGKVGLLGKAGLVGTALGTGYFGAKALGADRLGKFLGGKAYDLTHRGDTHVTVDLDGAVIARKTVRHNENQLSRRRRQRAHSRRSTR